MNYLKIMDSLFPYKYDIILSVLCNSYVTYFRKTAEILDNVDSIKVILLTKRDKFFSWTTNSVNNNDYNTSL